MPDDADRRASMGARYARADVGARDAGGEWQAHTARLDRLAANRRAAEASGWTSLALERDGDRGPFRLVGIPPGESLRTDVPDVAERGGA